MSVVILREKMKGLGLDYLFDRWNDPTVRKNLITDGVQIESYETAQLAVNQYLEWLQSQDFEQPVKYYCDQTVDHVLFLVALSFSGLTFYVLALTHEDSDTTVSGDEIYLERRGKFDCRAIPRCVSRRPQQQSNDEFAGCTFFKTSGSLANPKTVVHEFQVCIKNSKNVLTRLPIRSSDRVLIPVPICHMYGYGAALWPCLLAGASIRLATNMNFLKLREIERSYHPNVIFSTPAMLNLLAKLGRQSTEYRFVVSAGDCFDTGSFAAIQRKFNKVYDLYGSTELGVIAIGEVIIKNGSIINALRVVPNVSVRINNNELMIRHDYGFLGYLHDSDKQEWFNTHDLVEKVSGDSFRVVGRSDLSVNREGRLVSFRDVENRLKKNDFVEDVAIVRGEPDRKGYTMIALCQLTKPIGSAQLRQKFREVVSDYHLPSQVCIVKELPKLANGKLNRKILNKLTQIEGC